MAPASWPWRNPPVVRRALHKARQRAGYIFISASLAASGAHGRVALVVVQNGCQAWAIKGTVRGLSVGPLLFPLVLQALVESVGWRDAWFIMGIALIVLAGPGAFFIIRSPEDVGLRPDGDKEEAPPRAGAPQTPAGARGASPGPGGRVSAASEVSLTRREALQPPVWMPWAIEASCIRDDPNFQLFISLRFRRHDRRAHSAYAVPAIVMGFVFGGLADRHGPQRPFLAVCSIVASGLFLVSLVSQFQSTGMMFATMLYLGFGLNAFFVVSQVFVANTFGRQHLGAIRGVMQTVNNLATFGGPWIFGVLFDLYADYALLFGFAIVVWLVTIVLEAVRPLHEPPVPSAPVQRLGVLRRKAGLDPANGPVSNVAQAVLSSSWKERAGARLAGTTHWPNDRPGARGAVSCDLTPLGSNTPSSSALQGETESSQGHLYKPRKGEVPCGTSHAPCTCAKYASYLLARPWDGTSSRRPFCATAPSARLHAALRRARTPATTTSRCGSSTRSSSRASVPSTCWPNARTRRRATPSSTATSAFGASTTACTFHPAPKAAHRHLAFAASLCRRSSCRTYCRLREKLDRATTRCCHIRRTDCCTPRELEALAATARAILAATTRSVTGTRERPATLPWP